MLGARNIPKLNKWNLDAAGISLTRLRMEGGCMSGKKLDNVTDTTERMTNDENNELAIDFASFVNFSWQFVQRGVVAALNTTFKVWYLAAFLFRAFLY